MYKHFFQLAVKMTYDHQNYYTYERVSINEKKKLHKKEVSEENAIAIRK